MPQPQHRKTNNFGLEDFQFLGDHVLVKAIKAESVDGLVNPKQADDKPEFGLVISCGESVKTLSVGDTIMFGKYTTEETRHNGETYFFVHYEDIKGVLKK